MPPRAPRCSPPQSRQRPRSRRRAAPQRPGDSPSSAASASQPDKILTARATFAGKTMAAHASSRTSLCAIDIAPPTRITPEIAKQCGASPAFFWRPPVADSMADFGQRLGAATPRLGLVDETLELVSDTTRAGPRRGANRLCKHCHAICSGGRRVEAGPFHQINLFRSQASPKNGSTTRAVRAKHSGTNQL